MFLFEEPNQSIVLNK
ncbi:hypothetical protein LINGRAHAP2_LOCUS38015 [Linum grandiflorum]